MALGFPDEGDATEDADTEADAAAAAEEEEGEEDTEADDEAAAFSSGKIWPITVPEASYTL